MIHRIIALLIRYQNMAIGSFPRLLSIFYWPSVQILFWGYFTNFFAETSVLESWNSINIILSAVVLWDILFRSQLGLSMSFFEELWSRNLPNLFLTPIRDYEIILGLVFFLVLQPTSFFMKIFGYDPLRLKKTIKNSYKEDKTNHKVNLKRIF